VRDLPDWGADEKNQGMSNCREPLEGNVECLVNAKKEKLDRRTKQIRGKTVSECTLYVGWSRGPRKQIWDTYWGKVRGVMWVGKMGNVGKEAKKKIKMSKSPKCNTQWETKFLNKVLNVLGRNKKWPRGGPKTSHGCVGERDLVTIVGKKKVSPERKWGKQIQNRI